jgi:hypothetical protein
MNLDLLYFEHSREERVGFFSPVLLWLAWFKTVSSLVLSLRGRGNLDRLIDSLHCTLSVSRGRWDFISETMYLTNGIHPGIGRQLCLTQVYHMKC